MANVITEQELGNEVTSVEKAAMGIVITDKLTYEEASTFAKNIKATQKKIKDYWEPIRVAAKTAYDSVLAKKKEMLDPMDAAEKEVKAKMTSYLEEIERKRREAEEELRRQAREEAERKLKEAAESGSEEDAEFLMMEAEMMEDASQTATVAGENSKVGGVAQVKDFEIIITKPNLVPINFNGIEFRPVDAMAVKKFVKMTKGTIQIPGVEIREKVTLRIGK